MKKLAILFGIVIIVGATTAIILVVLAPHHDSPTLLTSGLVQRPSPDIPALKIKADKGDPEAQFLLGTAWAKGQGLTNNYEEAAKWYRRAADQGHAGAQAGLGELYEAGQ